MDLPVNSTSFSLISPQIQFIFIIVFLPPEFSSQNTHLRRLTALMNDSQWLTLLNQINFAHIDRSYFMTVKRRGRFQNLLHIFSPLRSAQMCFTSNGVQPKQPSVLILQRQRLCPAERQREERRFGKSHSVCLSACYNTYSVFSSEWRETVYQRRATLQRP